jgi:hypothetical protein
MARASPTRHLLGPLDEPFVLGTGDNPGLQAGSVSSSHRNFDWDGFQGGGLVARISTPLPARADGCGAGLRRASYGRLEGTRMGGRQA